MKEYISDWMRSDLEHGLPKLYSIKLDLYLLRSITHYGKIIACLVSLHCLQHASLGPYSQLLHERNQRWSNVFDHAMHHDYLDLSEFLRVNWRRVLGLPKSVLQKSVDYLEKVG